MYNFAWSENFCGILESDDRKIADLCYFSLSESFSIDNENGKFPTLSASSHGSLSSITTTSIASSDDPKGGDDGVGKGFDRKLSRNGTPVKIEEWWKTTLQVSIPFLIAGIGTIGAGVVLGRVEVTINNFLCKTYIIDLNLIVIIRSSGKSVFRQFLFK